MCVRLVTTANVMCVGPDMLAMCGYVLLARSGHVMRVFLAMTTQFICVGFVMTGHVMCICLAVLPSVLPPQVRGGVVLIWGPEKTAIHSNG